MQQGFDQSVPGQVANTVYSLEQFETEAEWVEKQAIEMGDIQTAKLLEDVGELAHVQQKLLVRQSPLAGTVGQCTRQAIQQSVQQLQQSQVPGIQQVVQQAQQLGQQIPQAAQQAQQLGQQGAQMRQQGGQFGQGASLQQF
jgi:DNA anti-recombination protein RmuC